MSTSNKAWKERLAVASASAARAQQKEREGDFQAAYSLCIQTAQSYLWLIRNTDDEKTKETLKAASARVLGRAEKIKAVKADARLEPTSFVDELEQAAVLEGSSIINQARYPRWPEQLPAELVDATLLYSDPYGHFPLSSAQKAAFHSFKRISELSEKPCILSRHAVAADIMQNCVTDCSVISGLIACLHHHSKFGSKLAIDRLYPQDETGWPVYNARGQYLARLQCNGTERQVVIDDYYPVDSSGRLLCASMLADQHWAACLEKAYVKIHGGYQIAGSDPSIDVHAFTGWIPEAISFKSQTFRTERTWQRLRTAFQEGSCILNVGTGKDAVTLEGGHTFASKHAYAVLDMLETTGGARIVTILDPWAAAEAMNAMSLTDPESVSRVWQVPWEKLCVEFHAIYCNWQPSRFEYRESVHALCEVDDVLDLGIQLGPSSAIEGDEVWVLVTKHIQAGDKQEYIGVQAVETTPHKQAPSRSSVSVEFSNSFQILVKVQPERTQARISVTISRKGTAPHLRVSLTAYSKCVFRLTDQAASMPYAQKLTGSWAGKSAGGNPSLPTFILNPHYRFSYPAIYPAGRSLSASLMIGTDTPINLKLIKLDSTRADERIQQYETCAITADSGSGSYTRRVAHLSVTGLDAGTYALIPSIFQADQQAEFVLRLRSAHPLSEMQLLPQEDAGRISRTIKGSWSGLSAGGSSQYMSFADNPRFKLHVPTTGNYRFRLTSQASEVPIRLAVCRCASDGSVREEVLGSRAYASYIAGVSMPESQLKASKEGYWIIPSTFYPGSETTFKLVIVSSHKIVVEEGQ